MNDEEEIYVTLYQAIRDLSQTHDLRRIYEIMIEIAKNKNDHKDRWDWPLIL